MPSKPGDASFGMRHSPVRAPLTAATQEVKIGQYEVGVAMVGGREKGDVDLSCSTENKSQRGVATECFTKNRDSHQQTASKLQSYRRGAPGIPSAKSSTGAVSLGSRSCNLMGAFDAQCKSTIASNRAESRDQQITAIESPAPPPPPLTPSTGGGPGARTQVEGEWPPPSPGVWEDLTRTVKHCKAWSPGTIGNGQALNQLWGSRKIESLQCPTPSSSPANTPDRGPRLSGDSSGHYDNDSIPNLLNLKASLRSRPPAATFTIPTPALHVGGTASGKARCGGDSGEQAAPQLSGSARSSRKDNNVAGTPQPGDHNLLFDLVESHGRMTVAIQRNAILAKRLDDQVRSIISRHGHALDVPPRKSSQHLNAFGSSSLSPSITPPSPNNRSHWPAHARQNDVASASPRFGAPPSPPWVRDSSRRRTRGGVYPDEKGSKTAECSVAGSAGMTSTQPRTIAKGTSQLQGGGSGGGRGGSDGGSMRDTPASTPTRDHHVHIHPQLKPCDSLTAHKTCDSLTEHTARSLMRQSCEARDDVSQHPVSGLGKCTDGSNNGERCEGDTKTSDNDSRDDNEAPAVVKLSPRQTPPTSVASTASSDDLLFLSALEATARLRAASPVASQLQAESPYTLPRTDEGNDGFASPMSHISASPMLTDGDVSSRTRPGHDLRAVGGMGGVRNQDASTFPDNQWTDLTVLSAGGKSKVPGIVARISHAHNSTLSPLPTARRDVEPHVNGNSDHQQATEEGESPMRVEGVKQWHEVGQAQDSGGQYQCIATSGGREYAHSWARWHHLGATWEDGCDHDEEIFCETVRRARHGLLTL